MEKLRYAEETLPQNSLWQQTTRSESPKRSQVYWCEAVLFVPLLQKRYFSSDK